MRMKVSRTSSTTASSASRVSKTSSSKSSSASKSSSKSSSVSKSTSKTSSSRGSIASASSSKTSTSKSSSASKNSSKTSSSATKALAKSVTKESSSKDSSATQTNSGNIDGLSAVYTGALISSKIATRTISNSSNTKTSVQSAISGAMCGAAIATKDTTQRINKYITDAPVIYTRQGLDSTVGSSTPAGYIPGMPSSEYEKYKKSLEPKFNGKNDAINKMLNNLDKDKTLKLSEEKKIAMLYAAEQLLNKGYETKFVAGVLGNIMNEGEAGKFESSAYSKSSEKPDYLKYMDDNFNYRNKFSGQNISEVGIKETIKLQKKVEATKYYDKDGNADYEGKFGLGTCQFTGSRTSQLLDCYKKYYNETHNNHPSTKECAKIEVDFMMSELDGSYNKRVYQTWREGDKTASSAGEIVCKKYERPHDTINQASERAENAKKIYSIMKK